MRTIVLPGDKSISHRIAMLAAVSDGPCRFRNFNTGADCESTLACLQSLGAKVDRGPEVRIVPATLHSPSTPLDCGNSGSTIRMLCGLLAGWGIPAVLTGDDSLRKRPMRRVADPLREMGAVIDLYEGEFAPIVLRSGARAPIHYAMQVSSAQVKSAVLFAGLRFPGTTVTERLPSRDHTERLFSYLHLQPAQDIRIPAFEYDVPGDPSSAAFFVVACLMQQGAEMELPAILMNPHRTGFLRVLQRVGAIVAHRNDRMVQNEPVADLRVTSAAALSPIVVSPDEVPSLIDEIPALAVLGTTCGFEVTGAAELRHKETDRITALAQNLRSLGITVHEAPDGLRVEKGRMQPAIVRSYGDHRIAMAFAAAGMEIDDSSCVRISFPEFFDLLRSTRD